MANNLQTVPEQLFAMPDSIPKVFAHTPADSRTAIQGESLGQQATDYQQKVLASFNCKCMLLSRKRKGAHQGRMGRWQQGQEHNCLMGRLSMLQQQRQMTAAG